MKRSRFSYGCYRVIRWLVWLFYPKIKVEGQENLPEGGCILVGNHAQMHGPVCGELYVPGDRAIWCNWEMMVLKEVPAYAYQDFWSKKPKYIRWFFKIMSYVIAPLAVCIFNNANTIPVYRDARLRTTLKQTLTALDENKRIVIFPEHYEPHNHIVNDFQEGFVDVAKLFYRRTGKTVSFVPMYLAPRLKKICFGKPIQFDPTADIAAERKRLCTELMDRITEIAEGLPVHKVVPYANLSPKDYVTNIPTEGLVK